MAHAQRPKNRLWLGQPEQWSTTVAFGSAAMPTAGLSVALVMFLPQYYASELGLSLAVIGGVFAAAKLVALVFDPLMGVLVDRTRTPIGRFRPWMLLAGPLIMISAYMLFSPGPAVTIAYVAGSLTLLLLGLSMWGVTQGSWAAALRGDYHGRNRVYAAMQVGAMCGVLVSVGLTALAARIADDSQAAGMRAVAYFILVAVPLTAMICLLRTPEGVQPARGTPVRLADFREILSRPTTLRLLAAQVLIGLGGGMLVASYRFLFIAGKGFSNADANALLLCTILGGIISPGLAVVAARRLGKHVTLMLAILGVCICLLILVLLPPGMFVASAAVLLLTNTFGGAPQFLLFSMSADAADEFRLDTGKERTGLLYAVISTGNKFAAAGAVYLAFTLLSLAGFNARTGAHNDFRATVGLYVCFAGAPIILYGLGAMMLWRYRLNAVRHHEVRVALAARDATASDSADPVGPASDGATSVKPTPSPA